MSDRAGRRCALGWFCAAIGIEPEEFPRVSSPEGLLDWPELTAAQREAIERVTAEERALWIMQANDDGAFELSDEAKERVIAKVFAEAGVGCRFED